MRGRRYNSELVYNFICEISGFAAVYKYRFSFSVAAEHHVVYDVHISDKTHAESVLGNKREAYAELLYLERCLIE